MEKVFEDHFSELQADMVSICLEYVEKRADKIYIYCSFENNVVSSGFFYKVRGRIVKKHKLNEAAAPGQERYDVSVARQKGAIDIINEDIKAIIKLCGEYGREVPTQIKLVYDITANKLNAEYSYEQIIGTGAGKSANDVLEEWFASETAAAAS